jgi:hypothetical protein
MKMIKVSMPRKHEHDLGEQDTGEHYWIEIDDTNFEDQQLAIYIYGRYPNGYKFEVGNIFVHKALSSDERWKNTYYVLDVNSQHGWGPLLYDKAFEYLKHKGKYLISNSEATKRGIAYYDGDTSSEARNVWDFYDNNRDDVQRGDYGYYLKSYPEKSLDEIRKPYLNIDYWEMYANSCPYRPEDIPEEILQHPRIQKALTSISSWVNALKIFHYRIDDCPESIKRHPEIQKAYMDEVKRDLINTQFVKTFYKKVNEFSDQLKSSSFLRDIETIYWDRNLKENLSPFCDYLYRIKENSSLFNILHDALPKSWSKERVDRFIGKWENDPKEEVPKEEVTANRVFKLIKVIG